MNWLVSVTTTHTHAHQDSQQQQGLAHLEHNRSISSSKVPPTYTYMTTTSRGQRMIWAGRRLPAMPTSAPGVGTKLGVVLAKLLELIVTQKSKQVCVGTSVITNIESLSLKVD